MNKEIGCKQGRYKICYASIPVEIKALFATTGAPLNYLEATGMHLSLPLNVSHYPKAADERIAP
ncbi:hypothetical protein [Methylomicrobium lacus]|uniref:hypothetical protein n=1 Tax=Methylomicrobium lacus TaxID=136992 RepID=UPI001268713D|nr:hypothetical protein [Methylomicrobium lacus]